MTFQEVRTKHTEREIESTRLLAEMLDGLDVDEFHKIPLIAVDSQTHKTLRENLTIIDAWGTNVYINGAGVFRMIVKN